ncbi:MAG TPA: amidohydrolase family protein [Candidatus Binataceae bacterium]|jgi:predicted TIM-barrel fold metal-dependent hydrolase|nr:amidohydrolase family protein [Candidatus Binataceae bacterium]
MTQPLVIDADGHILEPPDLWERYLEPKFKDRAMRIGKDERGLEYLEIDRKHSKLITGGTLGILGGAYQDCADLSVPGKYTYWEIAQRTPGGIDPHARIREMDEQGIDVAVLYGTISLAWEEECTDPELSAAYCRAYNNYAFDYCSAHPDRLIPIAQVSLRDVELAVQEVKRVKGKAKGLFYTPFPVTGRSVGDRYYDPFWAAAEEAELPVAVHVQVFKSFHGHTLHESRAIWLYMMQLPGETQLSLNCMFQDGVLERFPKLKYVVLEIGCGWLPHWMERGEEKFKTFGFGSPQMSKNPGELFRERCWISTEVDETTIAAVLEKIGARRILWATDSPHIDAAPNPLPELREHIAQLSEQDQEWILGKAAAELYRL